MFRTSSPPLVVLADRRVRAHPVAAIARVVVDTPVAEIAPDAQLHLELAPCILQAVTTDHGGSSRVRGDEANESSDGEADVQDIAVADNVRLLFQAVVAGVARSLDRACL